MFWKSVSYVLVVVCGGGGDVSSIDRVPFDATRPNPSGLECDNLYIDMNGIIHPCCHPENGPQPSSEEEMMENVCRYVDRLFRAIRPRQLLYLAIDGVAPRAKMNQQRARRFRAAQEARELLELEQRVALEQHQGLYAGTEYDTNNKNGTSTTEISDSTTPAAAAAWDSNVITPGTPFMLKLSTFVRFYVRKRMATDKAWKQIKVIVSDASIPGEGEHKIMAHVRLQRSQPGYNPNLVHVLHGLDADLIMLALATHEAHFYICREEVLFGRKSMEAKEQRQQESGFAIQQQLFDQAAAIGNDAAFQLPENNTKPLQRISIPILRDYLQAEFESCLKPPSPPPPPSSSSSLSLSSSSPFKPSLERLIDDIVFLCFFVGNDFLPHLPSLDIRDGALDFLFNVYKRVLPSLGDYITKSGGQVNLNHVNVILEHVGSIEDYVFGMKHETEERMKQQKAQQEQLKGSQKRKPHHYQVVADSQQQHQQQHTVRGKAAKILQADAQLRPVKEAGGHLQQRQVQAAKAEHNRTAALAIQQEISLQQTKNVVVVSSSTKDNNDKDKDKDKDDKKDGEDDDDKNQDDTPTKKKKKKKRKSEEITSEEEEEEEEETTSSSKNKKDKKKKKKKKNGSKTKDSEKTTNKRIKTEEEDEEEENEETGVGIVGDAQEEFDKDDDEETEVEEEEEDEEAAAVTKEAVQRLLIQKQQQQLDPEVLKEKVKAAQQKRLDDFANNVIDNVRLHEPGWRDRYYSDKCKADDVEQHGGREHLFRSYIVGLAWVMKYYYDGCPNWTWYYPFHYGPFASDLKNIDRFQPDVRAMMQANSKPFNPVEQLMAVLPSDSAHAIPKAARWLMLDEESPILDFYPKDVPVDPNGKAMPWLWVVLLPFIEEERLLQALHPTMDKWSAVELLCNARGLDDGYLYVHQSHPMVAQKLQRVLAKGKTAKDPRVRLGGASTGNNQAKAFFGSVRPPLSDELYYLDPMDNGDPTSTSMMTEDVVIPLPPSAAANIHTSQVPDGLFTDEIYANKAVCVAFSEPLKLPHKSILLPGAKPLPSILTEEDKRIRRPRLGRGGSIANMGGGGGGGHNNKSHQSGYGSMNINQYERDLANRTGRGHQMNQAGTRSWGAMEPTPKSHHHYRGGAGAGADAGTNPGNAHAIPSIPSPFVGSNPHSQSQHHQQHQQQQRAPHWQQQQQQQQQHRPHGGGPGYGQPQQPSSWKQQQASAPQQQQQQQQWQQQPQQRHHHNQDRWQQQQQQPHQPPPRGPPSPYSEHFAGSSRNPLPQQQQEQQPRQSFSFNQPSYGMAAQQQAQQQHQQRHQHQHHQQHPNQHQPSSSASQQQQQRSRASADNLAHLRAQLSNTLQGHRQRGNGGGGSSSNSGQGGRPAY